LVCVKGDQAQNTHIGCFWAWKRALSIKTHHCQCTFVLSMCWAQNHPWCWVASVLEEGCQAWTHTNVVHQQESLFSFRFFKVFLSFWVSKNHNTCKLIKTWKYLLTELSLKSSLTSIWGSKITIKEVFLKNSLGVKVLGFRSFFNF